jgi:CBS domain-containing protein
MINALLTLRDLQQRYYLLPKLEGILTTQDVLQRLAKVKKLSRSIDLVMIRRFDFRCPGQIKLMTTVVSVRHPVKEVPVTWKVRPGDITKMLKA